MPSVSSHYSGDWVVVAIFNAAKISNLTTKFDLLTTREPVVNFTILDDVPLEVKVNTQFQITCQAFYGQPLPIG